MQDVYKNIEEYNPTRKCNILTIKGTIAIAGARADTVTRQADVRDKGVIFKNSTLLTRYIS